MKILIVLCLCLFLIPAIGLSEVVTLDSPQAISSPEAVTMDWRVVRLDSEAQILTVTYRWRAADGSVIYAGDKDGWRTWRCTNNEETCFSDVFSFQVRTQDVGTSIGVGLRTLIWNKFRSDILGANDGTFD